MEALPQNQNCEWVKSELDSHRDGMLGNVVDFSYSCSTNTARRSFEITRSAALPSALNTCSFYNDYINCAGAAKATMCVVSTSLYIRCKIHVA